MSRQQLQYRGAHDAATSPAVYEQLQQAVAWFDGHFSNDQYPDRVGRDNACVARGLLPAALTRDRPVTTEAVIHLPSGACASNEWFHEPRTLFRAVCQELDGKVSQSARLGVVVQDGEVYREVGFTSWPLPPLSRFISPLSLTKQARFEHVDELYEHIEFVQMLALGSLSVPDVIGRFAPYLTDKAPERS